MLHDSGEAVMVIRVPELFASEAADVLGIELSKGPKLTRERLRCG